MSATSVYRWLLVVGTLHVVEEAGNLCSSLTGGVEGNVCVVIVVRVQDVAEFTATATAVGQPAGQSAARLLGANEQHHSATRVVTSGGKVKTRDRCQEEHATTMRSACSESLQRTLREH